MIEIKIESSAVTAALDKLQASTQDVTPLMTGIRAALRSITEENLHAEKGTYPLTTSSYPRRRVSSGTAVP